MSDCEHDYRWYLQTNEEGWKCIDCGHKPGEPPGFSPQLDRELVDIKVNDIMIDLHERDFIYVSNGDMGESLGFEVAIQCKRHGLYDQYAIAAFILRALNSHSDYWRKISEGILAGEDPRKRCECGALATVYCGSDAQCFEHARGQW